MPTTNYRSGDFTISEITLENWNKSEQTSILLIVDEICIEESMFVPCVYGYVDISDTSGLHVEFPIFGQEKLIINYSTSTDPEFQNQTKEFRVYKLANKKEDKAGKVSYRLYFTSEEFIANEKIKISKAYVNKTTSEIVRDIFSFLDTDKPIEIDPTLYNQKLIIPFLNPFEAISWLTSFSQDSESDGSAFVFYETLDGFKFKSLKTLLKQSELETYGRNFKNTEKRTNDELDASYRGIEDLYSIQTCDALGNIDSGLLGSELYTLDLLTRKYTKKLYDYRDVYDNQIHLETGDINTTGLYTTDSDLFSTQACRKFVISPTVAAKSSYVRSKQQDTQLFSTRRETLIQNTISQLQQLDQINYNVVVAGDSRVKAGSVVKLEIPSYAIVKSGAEELDRYYSGRYLVKSVRHVIAGSKYTTTMECLKDSVYSKRENIKTTVGNK